MDGHPGGLLAGIAVNAWRAANKRAEARKRRNQDRRRAA